MVARMNAAEYGEIIFLLMISLFNYNRGSQRG